MILEQSNNSNTSKMSALTKNVYISLIIIIIIKCFYHNVGHYHLIDIYETSRIYFSLNESDGYTNISLYEAFNLLINFTNLTSSFQYTYQTLII